jgi:hypothetical protein
MLGLHASLLVLAVAPSLPGEPPPDALLEAVYRIERSSQDVWTARNPAQDLYSSLTPHGVEVRSDRGTLGLSLAAWGRSDHSIPVAAGETVASGRRFEVRRGALTEWYVNDARGLEQGFTIDEAPVGVGELELVLACGSLQPEVDATGRDATFHGVGGTVLFHYSGLVAWDAAGNDLPASMHASEGRLVLRVDDAGASYPVTVDPWIWSEQAKLTDGAAATNDTFGSGIAVSGDTALVGVAGDDDGGANKGSAFVYLRTGTTWTEQAMLTASDGVAADAFGHSVALEGDTAVVGALLGDGLTGDAGTAYVFTRSGTVWTEEAKLTASEGGTGDEFGSSVAVSGDTAVVGAKGDNTPAVSGGSMYVFTRSGTVWNEEQRLVAADTAPADALGTSVSVDGDTAIAGAPTDNVFGFDSGSVYVFDRVGTTWTQTTKLTPSDSNPEDHFGTSAALSGDSIVAGSPFDDDDGAISGSAYVFTRSGTVWSQEAKLTAGDAAAGDEFGQSVQIDGDTVAVGAPEEDEVANNAGAAYVFQRVGTCWGEMVKLTASDGTTVADFGRTVDVAGDTTVVGAPDADSTASFAGAAYVYLATAAPTVSYCTAGTSANGCQALISSSGTPSACAPSGFSLLATGVEGEKDGLFFFGSNGRQGNSWGNGTSFQCVVPPVKRAGLLLGNGTVGLCDGSFSQDLNAVWCPTCPKPQKNPGAGAITQAQLWYRDPLNTSNRTTSLSDAIEFCVGP